jgi:hypothetical protein
MIRIANFISVLFHPVFIPMWLMSIILWFADNSLLLLQPGRKLSLFIIISVFTTVLPLLNFLILKFMGFLTGFEMNDRRERNLPLIIGLVYYAGLFYLLIGTDIPLFYPGFVVSGFVLVLMNYLINRKWKISSHAIGAGGLTGTLILFSLLNRTDILFFISISFLFSGIILSSRLFLGKHSEAQIYWGYLIGLCVPMLFIPISLIVFLQFLYR